MQSRVSIFLSASLSSLHCPLAQPLIVHLKDGVETVDSLDKDGKRRGHFLRANKTGVVLLTRSEGQISEVEIRDALKSRA